MSHYCPRRDDMTRSLTSLSGAPGVNVYLDPEAQIGATPLQDEWRDGGHPWIDGGLPTCSYCGSLQPSEFIAAVKDGRVHGTDKAYKAYVDLTNPTLGRLACSSTSYGGEQTGPGWVRASDMTAEQREVAVRDGMLRSGERRRADDREPDWLHFAPETRTAQGKFYLQHIAHQCPERAALYDLVMSGANLGWYARGIVGMRQEHLLRHPELMTEDETKALTALRERIPEIVAP